MKKVLVVSGLVLAVFIAAISETSAQVSDQPIWACYDKTSGAMRLLLGPSGSRKCKKNEDVISWNTKGPTGPTGATGAKGATGAAGPTGPEGPGSGASVAIRQDMGGPFLNPNDLSTLCHAAYCYPGERVVGGGGEPYQVVEGGSTVNVGGAGPAILDSGSYPSTGLTNPEDQIVDGYVYCVGIPTDLSGQWILNAIAVCTTGIAEGAASQVLHPYSPPR